MEMLMIEYEPRVRAIAATQNPEHEDSVMWTFKFTIPKVYLAELNTHSVLSRSVSSSRAIPVNRNVGQENYYIPFPFTKNQKGMSSSEAIENQAEAIEIWETQVNNAKIAAKKLRDLGVHKQHANRVLDWCLYSTVILSGTEWDNFIALRADNAAQPEMQKLALEIKDRIENVTPEIHHYHLPFIDLDTKRETVRPDKIKELFLISAARCARTSYISNRTRRVTSKSEDLRLAKRLLDSKHMSPFEHQAISDQVATNEWGKKSWANPLQHQKLWGWKPYRRLVEEPSARRNSFGEF